MTISVNFYPLESIGGSFGDFSLDISTNITSTSEHTLKIITLYGLKDMYVGMFIQIVFIQIVNFVKNERKS